MICRLCIREIEEFINIFDVTGSKSNMASIVGKHFWFEVNKLFEHFPSNRNQEYLVISSHFKMIQYLQLFAIHVGLKSPIFMSFMKVWKKLNVS